MSLKKICARVGCNMLCNIGETYCNKHKLENNMRKKKQYKEYRNTRLENVVDSKCQQFYNNKIWIATKESVKNRLLHTDWFEYYTTGRIIAGNTLHHIVEVKDDWNKRLDENNLIYLSYSNHCHIHKQYNKSLESKREMQNFLLECLYNFKKDFCL